MPCDVAGDLRPRFFRSAFLAASVVVASLALPARVEAGGAVVPLEGQADPSVLDVRVAVAVSPTGTTRWSEVTVPASNRVLWLVPARPGATIGWAANGWLSSLEEATAPHILPPVYKSSCDFRTAPERTPAWTLSASKQPPAPYTVHATVESVRSAASGAGFAIDAELDARIVSLYASGFQLVALEIASSNGSTSSSTLRVSDDGGAVLPVALVGLKGNDTRVTAFAIGNGVMGTSGAIKLTSAPLYWGTSGSNFVTWRRDVLNAANGDAWLRETASHAALFEGTLVNGGSPTLSVVDQYLDGKTCETSAKNAGDSDAVVGASLSASTFACEGLDDLAIALWGLAPRSAVVTRWSGIIPRGQLGVDRAVAFDAQAVQAYPAVRAGSYDNDTCESPPSAAAPSRPLAPGGTTGGGTTDDGVVVTGGPDVVYVGDGCGGGTTTTTEYEDEETTTTTSSDDGCGGDTTTTSTSSDDGWDSSDSSDSCSSDTSDSSSSSDSCGSDSSSSSSDSCDSGGSGDGWDTSDMSAKKTSLKSAPKRSKSPFSRYALFAVALILPLRRRARAALERR
jgi:hypothetical protein